MARARKQASQAATSASTACASRARAPSRKTSVSGFDKSSWLAELENVSRGHGVSPLRWRSGGVEHMPSPTFVNVSRVTVLEMVEQRRFIRGLNSHSEGSEITYVNGSGRLEAGNGLV
jgi:hypothetical protein